MTDRLWANPTLHRRDTGWSWIAWHADGVEEHWSPATAELDAVIAAARGGARRDELLAVIADDDAAELVDSLLAAGVLVVPARTVGTRSEGSPRAASTIAAGELIAAFARDHGDTEVPLLASAEVPTGGGSVLAGLTLAAPAARPAPAPTNAAIVADVVLPDGPPPATPHAIALAPIDDADVTWLALDDLRVSIVDEQLVLRSIALDRAILPRLHRAIGPADPGMLRLLAAIGEGTGARAFPERGLQTSFPLGSEWLEVKLYTSQRLADRVLAELVLPVVAAATVDDWHFLRYADPRWHLRARLHGAPRVVLREVLPALREAAEDWLADGRIVDLQVGTYRREVGRYGGASGVVIAERMFTADSMCVAQLCAVIGAADDPEEARWRIAAVGISALVADLVPEQMPATLTAMRDDFLYRVGAVGLTAHAAALAERFADVDLDDARAVVRERSARLAPLVEELRVLERAGRLARPIASMAPSFVHMFANRLLRGFALEQELVLYELLCTHAIG